MIRDLKRYLEYTSEMASVLEATDNPLCSVIRSLYDVVPADEVCANSTWAPKSRHLNQTVHDALLDSMSEEEATAGTKALWGYLDLDFGLSIKIRQVYAFAKDCMAMHGHGQQSLVKFNMGYQSEAFEAYGANTVASVPTVIRCAHKWNLGKAEQHRSQGKTTTTADPIDTEQQTGLTQDQAEGMERATARNVVQKVLLPLAPQTRGKVEERSVAVKLDNDDFEVVALEELEVTVEGSEAIGGAWDWL